MPDRIKSLYWHIQLKKIINEMKENIQIIKAKDLNEGDTFKPGIKTGNTHWAEKVSVDGEQVTVTTWSRKVLTIPADKDILIIKKSIENQ